MARYKEVKFLGSGGFGSVYEASNGVNVVALKKIPLEGNSVEDIRECSILQSLRNTDNDNIIKLVDDAYVENGSLCLPFELAFSSMDKYMPESPQIVKSYLHDILNGVSGFHTDIVHRDLKPENILLVKNEDGSMVAKVADFGMGKALLSMGICMTPHQGPIGYKAPEVLIGSKFYGAPADIWSVGAIFFEMLTGKQLLSGGADDLEDIQRKVGKITKSNMPHLSYPLDDVPYEGLGPDIENQCEHAVDLLKELLTINPAERITAKDALEHAYFLE